MDRLEKIKGYKDKLSKDDGLWLVAELSKCREQGDRLAGLLATSEDKRERMAAEVARLRGEGPATCPCNSPDSHAGWCPRR